MPQPLPSPDWLADFHPTRRFVHTQYERTLGAAHEWLRLYRLKLSWHIRDDDYLARARSCLRQAAYYRAYLPSVLPR